MQRPSVSNPRIVRPTRDSVFFCNLPCRPSIGRFADDGSVGVLSIPGLPGAVLREIPQVIVGAVNRQVFCVAISESPGPEGCKIVPLRADINPAGAVPLVGSDIGVSAPLPHTVPYREKPGVAGAVCGLDLAPSRCNPAPARATGAPPKATAEDGLLNPAVAFAEPQGAAIAAKSGIIHCDKQAEPLARQIYPLRSASAQGVSVLVKAANVRPAKTASLVRLAATRNRTYRLYSHGADPLRGGQGRALLTQRFRPDFPSRFSLCSQRCGGNF